MLEPLILAFILFTILGGFKSETKKDELKEKYEPWIKISRIKDKDANSK